MNKPILYLSLATEFFDLDKPKASPEEYAFFRHYIAKATGPILEPMCGTGRYLIPYLEEGFEIAGFDASPFMFNALREKCKHKNIQPHVWEKFLEGVETTQLYNLIFIPDSSFCLFLDRNHIMMCLRKIHSLLEHGGVFVFDIETIYGVPAHTGIWQGKAYKKSDGTTLICSTLPLEIENNVATVICRYEHVDKTAVIATEMEYFQIKLYYPTEMDAILNEVGFSKVKRIEAYNLIGSPSAQDYTIVYECTK